MTFGTQLPEFTDEVQQIRNDHEGTLTRASIDVTHRNLDVVDRFVEFCTFCIPWSSRSAYSRHVRSMWCRLARPK